MVYELTKSLIENAFLFLHLFHCCVPVLFFLGQFLCELPFVVCLFCLEDTLSFIFLRFRIVLLAELLFELVDFVLQHILQNILLVF